MPNEVVEQLYAAPPERFVAQRAEAIAAARAAGDGDAAREIAKLRKPTVAAWLVNLLAIRRPDLLAELVELSAALRSAQRDLRGPQLRELSAQRRAAVNALIAETRALAVAADPALARAKLPLAEVEATFNAALSDADVAEQVRSGRLVRAVTYAGFGEVPRPQLRLVTGGAEEEVPADRRAGEQREAARRERGEAETSDRARKAEEAARAARRRALTKELSSARTQQKRADSELERAAAAERDGAAVLAEIETALADLERRRVAAENELSRRKLARKAAERTAVSARRRIGEVEAAVEALDAEAGAVGVRR